jgi:mycothiol system anti-sigma-R factor
MTRVMSCRDAVRRLWQLLDGDLEAGETQRVEHHLEQCVSCCGELEFARELRRLLDAQRRADLPDDVRERLDQFVDRLGTPAEGDPAP